MIINFPEDVKDVVNPVDRPTVPIADVASNIMFSKAKLLCRSVIASSIVAANNTAEKTRVTVIALPTIAGFIERLNISTSFRLRMFAQAVIIITQSVTVLIPPAVEPGEPPMNIKIVIIILPAELIFPMSTVLKPAVLDVTD